MISKALLKNIKTLELKKYRKESGLFVAEGSKTVIDLMNAGMKTEKLIATEEWISSHRITQNVEIITASEEEIKLYKELQKLHSV